METNYTNERIEYLKLLSKEYPNIISASNEIINLKAILELPKPTEHFLSDIHGQYDTFIHILNSGSGVIRNKIDLLFSNYNQEKKNELATLIYYPKLKTTYIEKNNLYTINDYKTVLFDLITIAKLFASKYTRATVKNLLDDNVSYIMQELLLTDDKTDEKKEYLDEIICAIIETDQTNHFIIELCILIQKLSVKQLHILGDIYDRGADATKIMDELLLRPQVDFTWGNHDILYMGAASGNYACIANVIRNACRYNTLSTLEEGYGISLRPLIAFALQYYEKDPCKSFYPSSDEASDNDDYDRKIISKIHKAITIIQLKLESFLSKKHPNYQNDNLRKIEFINFNNYTINLEEKEYNLIDKNFPTVNKDNPSKLSPAEHELMDKLASNFIHSEKLQKHVKFLLNNGAMYLKINGNLLFHGCIPTEKNGTFSTYTTDHNNKYSGKALLDYCDKKVRKAYYSKKDYYDKSDSVDFFWFLWCSNLSPIFGKKNICTFERYFLSKEDAKKFSEEKNDYYHFINDEKYCINLLKHFGLTNQSSRIINGHMPVNVKKGESPIKANGKLIVIDGGICKSYYNITGISGYTLVNNSNELMLTAHEPFIGKDIAIKTNKDIIHSSMIIEKYQRRLQNKNTDAGIELSNRINDLNELLNCYRLGMINQK